MVVRQQTQRGRDRLIQRVGAPVRRVGSQTTTSVSNQQDIEINSRIEAISAEQRRLFKQKQSISVNQFRGSIENRRRKAAKARKEIESRIRSLALKKFRLKKGRSPGDLRPRERVKSIQEAKASLQRQTAVRKAVSKLKSQVAKGKGTISLKTQTPSGEEIFVNRAGLVTVKRGGKIVEQSVKTIKFKERPLTQEELALGRSFDRKSQKEFARILAIREPETLKQEQRLLRQSKREEKRLKDARRRAEAKEFGVLEIKTDASGQILRMERGRGIVSIRGDIAKSVSDADIKKANRAIDDQTKEYAALVRKFNSYKDKLSRKEVASASILKKITESRILLFNKKTMQAASKSLASMTRGFFYGIADTLLLSPLRGASNVIQAISLSAVRESEKKVRKLIGLNAQQVRLATKIRRDHAAGRDVSSDVKKLSLLVNSKEYKLTRQQIERDQKIDSRIKGLILNHDTFNFGFILVTLGAFSTLKGLGTSGVRAVRVSSKRLHSGFSLALKVFGGVGTFQSSKELLKSPTPENAGRLVAFAVPTAFDLLQSSRSVFGTVQKILSPSYKANVKNAELGLGLLQKQKKKVKGLIKTTQQTKGMSSEQKLILKLRKEYLRDVDQAIRELKYVLRNDQIINTEVLNPREYTKNLKKLSNSYRDQYHVSNTPKWKKIFKKEKFKTDLSETEILNRILAKTSAKKKTLDVKPRKIPLRSAENKMIVNSLISSKSVLGGARAMNLQVGILRRRKTTDFDGKTLGNSITILNSLKSSLSRQYPSRQYRVMKLPNKGSARLFEVTKKRDVLDLTTVNKLPEYSINEQGLRVESIKSLLAGKANALSKRERFLRKGKTDLRDVQSLTQGALSSQKVLPKMRTKSRVLDVVRIKGGVGKDRLMFDEFHMYFDLSAPAYYGKGEPYTIIKIPKTRLNTFSKSLELRSLKASKGELSSTQTRKLRIDLNHYINANPNKFFLGPRTGSLPYGEREWVLATGSRLFTKDIYKTWDSDLKRMINVVEATFTPQKKNSFFKKFKLAYSKNPFKALKLRLTNPDILDVRRYSKLVERDLDRPLSLIQKFKLIVSRFLKNVKEGRVKSEKTSLGKQGVGTKPLTKKKAVARGGKTDKLTLAKKRVRSLGRKKTRQVAPRGKTSRRTTPQTKRAPATRRRTSAKPRLPVKTRTSKSRLVPPKQRTGVVKRPVRTSRVTTKRIGVPGKTTRAPPERRFLKKTKTKIKTKMPDDVSEKSLIRVTKNELTKKKFLYIPDLYSRIYGVKANAAERKRLLTKGGIFSGVSIRKLI